MDSFLASKILRWVLSVSQDQVCGVDYEVCGQLMGGQNCQVPCLPGFVLSNATEDRLSTPRCGKLSEVCLWPEVC